VSTTARLIVAPQPDLGKGAKKISVDCKWSTTTAWLVPGLVDLTDEQLVTSMLYRHESECGRCDTARLWQRADLSLRDAVEDAWQQMGTAELRERRN